MPPSVFGEFFLSPDLRQCQIVKLLALTLPLIAGASSSLAANLTWTTNHGGIFDGAGTWNQGSPSTTIGNGAWYNGTSYGVTMNGGDNVTFGGSTLGVAGTVTNGSGITPGNITLLTNYTIGANSSAPAITMNGGVITNASSGPVFNCPINGSFSYGSSGSGSIRFAGNGSQTATDSVTIMKGTLQIGNNGATGGLGAAVITNNGTLTWKRAGVVNVSNAVSGIGSVIYWGNNATFIVYSNQTYSGITTLLPTATNVPPSKLLLAGNNVLPTNTDFSITQLYSANGSPVGAPTNSVMLDLNGYNQTLGSIASDTNATATATVITNSSAIPATLTLGGAGKAKVFGGLIGGNLSLVLNGSGSMLTLSNVVNTYSGDTTINTGTLALKGGASIASPNINLTASTAVLDVAGVAGGYILGSGQTLSGIGVVTGAVTTAAGSVLAPGNPGAVGTLNFSNQLTLGGDLMVNINRSLSQSSDLINVAGQITNCGSGTITVSNLGTTPLLGDKFTLFSSPVANGAALTIIPPAGVALINNLAVDGSISVPPPANLTWTTTSGGIYDGSGIWNQGSSSITSGYGAWSNNTNYGVIMNSGDNVTFGNGVGGGAGTITIGGIISPGMITFVTPYGGGLYTVGATTSGSPINMNGGLITNSSSGGVLFNCVINGSFTLGSSASSIKLANNGNQNSTNYVTITKGSIQIGNNGSTGGLGAAVITNNGSLTWKQTGVINLFNTIYGTGSVKLWGNGATFLIWSNMFYTGSTILQPSSATVPNTLVQLLGNNVLPTNTALSILQNSAAPAGAQILDLNGYNQNVGSLSGDQFASAATEVITNSSATPAVLTLGGASMTSSFGGLIGGNISLILNGSGSVLTLSNVADSYVGNTLINAGTLKTTGLGGLASTPNIIINSGVLQINGSSVLGGGSYAGNITNNGSLTFNTSASQILAGNISGSGTLTQIGPSLLQVKGTSSYTGSTIVNGGKLQVNGVLGNSAVTVTNGGMLVGNGLIGGATSIKVGGNLIPGLGGADTSSLTISNNLSLAGNAIFCLNRNYSPSSASVDGISTLTYGGTLTVSNLGGALQSGDVFQLFQANNYSGKFSNWILPALSSGLFWNTNGLANGYISVIGTTSLPTVGIAASNLAKTFGQSPAFAGTEFSTGNLPNGITVTNVTLTSAGVSNNADAGTYVIVPSNAQGAGLTNCNLVYTNGILTVTPAVPVMTVTSGGSPTLYGDSVALTVRVTPVQAAGIVQFLTNGVLFDTEPLVGGLAISALNANLPVGTNQITAIFVPGDNNVLSATNSLQQIVTSAAPRTNGLAAQYFNNTGFTSLNTSLLDTNGINENWSNAVPAGTTLTNGRPFAVRWSGQIVPGNSEAYTFYVRANSGARLWINDHLLLNSVSPIPPNVEMSGTMTLTAGMRYNINLEYLSSGSNASVQVNWSSPSTPKQSLPAGVCVPFTDSHQRGSILTEIWQNLPGVNIGTLTGSTNYPNQPDMRDTHYCFQCIATNWGTNYGEKVSGYVVPLVGGYYTFSVAASDTAQLWLSTNASSANKILLLSVTEATGYQQYTNISVPVRLGAWQQYYVELLHKAGAGGNDHYSVAWQPPGQYGYSVIGGDNLVPNYLNVTNQALVSSYWTNLSKSHPRLQTSAERFAWLKSTIASGSIPNLNSWWLAISNSAVALETTPAVSTNDDGFYGCREMVSRMYTLALAYRITGDTNFAECAWANLQQVASSNYPSDWFASVKFLDTADMTRGVAIGYDWLYDYWTSNRLNTIATAIQNRGLNQGYLDYRGFNNNNVNLVCNSGMAAGALALGMDAGIGSLSYKTNIFLISNAVVSVAGVIPHYTADNGAWYEGPGYWDYGTRNFIPMLANLNASFGTDFGLSATPNLGEAGNFAMGIMGNTQPSNVSFGYCDTGFGTEGGMAMFWLARRYNRPEYAAYERASGYAAWSDGLAYLDIFWYDQRGTDPVSSNILPDSYYRGLTGTTAYNQANVVTMRTDWQDASATAVIFKTGSTSDSAHNQLEDGSFMLDALGVRWANNFGDDNYNLPGYFDNSTNGLRWTYYRLRAEGHNTLVINPTTNADQVVGCAPPIMSYASHPNGDDSYVVADLTSAYGINKVWRGVKLFNNRRWFLVQDELQATNPATVWWFMHITTSMNPIISSNGQSVLLTQGTSRLWLTNLTGIGSFVISNAVPLPTSPNPAGQATNTGYEKLAIQLTYVTNTTIAVLMVPLTLGQALPTNLPAVMPLTNWPAMDVSQPPILSVISNSTIIAGATLLVTNQANDPNLPPQPLAFSLAAAPTGATINSSSGVIFWRPTIAQAGLTYPFTVVVTELGGGQLSATQSFQVAVTSPVKPVLTMAGLAGGQFQMLVNGDYGPDYTVTVSTNLVSWASVFTTNSPALPFLWSESATNGFAQRFYRILLGP